MMKVCNLYVEKNWRRCEKNGNVFKSFLTKDIAKGKPNVNLKTFWKKAILQHYVINMVDVVISFVTKVLQN